MGVAAAARGSGASPRIFARLCRPSCMKFKSLLLQLRGFVENNADERQSGGEGSAFCGRAQRESGLISDLFVANFASARRARGGRLARPTGADGGGESSKDMGRILADRGALSR